MLGQVNREQRVKKDLVPIPKLDFGLTLLLTNLELLAMKPHNPNGTT